MATALKLGPGDHDRLLTWEEFESAHCAEGYRYELIDGRLYVSPQPELPFGFLEQWLFARVSFYSGMRPDVINFLWTKARVHLPGLPRETVPEPDLAAYRDFPLDVDLRTIRWRDVSPILVAEVISPDNPEKDEVRNVRLYRQVPSIQEYWIIDPRPDPNLPSLIAHRRSGSRWRRLQVASGDTYTTPLLPGFSLLVDPRRP